MQVFLLLLVVSIAATSATPKTSGKATYYYVSAGLTACGTRHSDTELVAAIGWPYWTEPNPNNDPLCLNNQRAVVTDLTSGKNVTVLIRDICGSCASTNIDLSVGAFQSLRPLSDGMFNVNWEFIGEDPGDGICRGRVTLSSGTLNVRETPDSNSPVIGQKNNGEITQIWWRTTGTT